MVLYFDYRFKAVLRIMLNHRKTINHRDKRFAYVFPALSKKSKTKKQTLGPVAEWLGRALQKLLHQFESGQDLLYIIKYFK